MDTGHFAKLCRVPPSQTQTNTFWTDATEAKDNAVRLQHRHRICLNAVHTQICFITIVPIYLRTAATRFTGQHTQPCCSLPAKARKIACDATQQRRKFHFERLQCSSTHTAPTPPRH